MHTRTHAHTHTHSPGQARGDDAYSCLIEETDQKSRARDLDTLSTASHSSSTDGSREQSSLTEPSLATVEGRRDTNQASGEGGEEEEGREGGEGVGGRAKEDKSSCARSSVAANDVEGGVLSMSHADRGEDKRTLCKATGREVKTEALNCGQRETAKKGILQNKSDKTALRSVRHDDGMSHSTAVLVDLSVAGERKREEEGEEEGEEGGEGGEEGGRVAQGTGKDEEKDCNDGMKGGGGGTEGVGGGRGGGGEVGTLSDQQMLLEVFSGEERSGAGGGGGREGEREQLHDVSYHVELSVPERLDLLLQSMDTSLESIR